MDGQSMPRFAGGELFSFGELHKRKTRARHDDGGNKRLARVLLVRGLCGGQNLRIERRAGDMPILRRHKKRPDWIAPARPDSLNNAPYLACVCETVVVTGFSCAQAPRPARTAAIARIAIVLIIIVLVFNSLRLLVALKRLAAVGKTCNLFSILILPSCHLRGFRPHF